MAQFGKEFLKSKDLCDRLTASLNIAQIYLAGINWKIDQITFFDKTSPSLMQLGVEVDKLVATVESLKAESSKTNHVQDAIKKNVAPTYKTLAETTSTLITSIDLLKENTAKNDPVTRMTEINKLLTIYDNTLKETTALEIHSVIADMQSEMKRSYQIVQHNWEKIEKIMGDAVPSFSNRSFWNEQKPLGYEICRLWVAVSKYQGKLPKDSTYASPIPMVGWLFEIPDLVVRSPYAKDLTASQTIKLDDGKKLEEAKKAEEAKKLEEAKKAEETKKLEEGKEKPKS